MGSELAEAAAHRGGVVSLRGLVRRFVSDGKAQEPCVVAEEGNGCHAQVVGHELERPTQEVVGQADSIGDRQHRETVERPGLVDQVRGVARHQALATHLTEGHDRFTRWPAGHHVDPGRPAVTRPLSSGGRRWPAGRRAPPRRVPARPPACDRERSSRRRSMTRRLPPTPGSPTWALISDHPQPHLGHRRIHGSWSASGHPRCVFRTSKVTGNVGAQRLEVCSRPPPVPVRRLMAPATPTRSRRLSARVCE